MTTLTLTFFVFKMLLLVLCALICNVAVNADHEACTRGQADVVIALDSSGSVGPGRFKTELTFVSDFVRGFPVGPNDVQFSLVIFSTTVQPRFSLDAHQTLEQLIGNLDDVRYDEGRTRTDLALKYIREHSFQPVNGGRPGVPKIVIVVTDGKSQSTLKTATEASLLDNAGVVVISVGVGKAANQKELNVLASATDLVFTVYNFEGLTDIVHDLQNAACTEMEGICGYDSLPVNNVAAYNPNCQWPWTARVMLGYGDDPYNMCMGIILGRNKVITAASCIDRQNVHSVVVGQGGEQGGVAVDVTSVQVHPSYSDKDNDVAVLRLARRVNYNACVLPVCLPAPRQQCDVISLEVCALTSWRYDAERAQYSSHDHDVEYLSPELCSQVNKYSGAQATPSRSVCITASTQDSQAYQLNEGMVSCVSNGSWIVQSLVTDVRTSLPSMGVDLRDPDILEFIKYN